MKSLFFLIIYSLLFVSCEEAEITELEFEERNPSSVLFGKMTYNKHCVSCHGPVEKSSKRNVNLNDLLSSIKNVSEMNHLKKLNNDELKSVVNVLSDGRRLTGKDHYERFCLSCHGDFDSTNKKGISTQEIKNAIAVIPEMEYLSELKTPIIESISKALEIKTSEYPQEKLLCKNKDIVAATDAQMLTPLQLRNSIRSLFGSTAVNQASVELDNLEKLIQTNGYTSFSTFNLDKNSISIKALIRTIQIVAPYAAERVISQTNCINNNNIKTNSEFSDSCFSEFMHKWGMKILRKRIDEEIVSHYRAQFNSFKGSDIKTPLTGLMFVMLMDPDFLFLFEDEGQRVADGVYTLNQFELASKLSFTLVQNTPDDQLLSLANQGKLDDVEIVKQVNRLIASDKGKNSVTRFLKELFTVNKYNYTSSYTLDFLNPEVNMSDAILLPEQASTEVQRFIEFIVHTQDGGMEEIYNSDYVNLSGLNSLAKVYDVNVDKNYLLRRSGILTRAAVHNNGTNWKHPMALGAMIRRNLLCDQLPNPPDDFDIESPEHSQNNSLVTTRQRLEKVTSQTACVGCHKTINGLAFAFDHIDSIGRSIASEKIMDPQGNIIQDLPINSSTKPNIYAGYSQTVNDGLELSKMISKSPKGKQCFSKRIVEYLNGRIAGAQDGCDIDNVNKLNKENASVKELFKSHILAKRFRVKKVRD